MADPAVCILLSTWNGARFLPAQLASFGAQTHPDWTVLWRDDGSTDATMSIMAAYAAASPDRLRDLRDRRGRMQVTESFLHLLRQAPAGIVAFSDQDDVWLPDKLARGIAAVSALPPGLPGLYFARQVLVDAALRPLRNGARRRLAPGFPGALTQNIATGCTIMLNDSAARLVAGSAPPAGTLHDWWCYMLVAAAGGQVVSDDFATVLYRQHAANAVGVPLSPVRRAVAALQRGPSVFMRAMRAHVEALSARPDLLSPQAAGTLAAIRAALAGGVLARMRVLGMPGLRRQSVLETALFRLWFIIG